MAEGPTYWYVAPLCIRVREADMVDKELRRYLVCRPAVYGYRTVMTDQQIWRWGIEGIVYDIDAGPKLSRARDQSRQRYLLQDDTATV